MEKLIRIDIIAAEDMVEIISGALALYSSYGWEEESLPTGETRFRVHCENAEYMDALMRGLEPYAAQVHIERTEIDKQDWTSAWREFFTPVVCGHFVVLPPWRKDDAGENKAIVIEPKSAFGTGHHATTALCLSVISRLILQGRVGKGQRFLDLGTGSGVLSLGCCLEGMHGIATDIDLLAVENAQENRDLNNIEGLEILLGSTEVVRGQHFDLVVANILARPLIELATDLVALKGEHGALVLSGLLDVQANSVVEAYTALGLPQPERVLDGEWCALVWA
jgi:ribosomal protein L11 methyltransferase